MSHTIHRVPVTTRPTSRLFYSLVTTMLGKPIGVNDTICLSTPSYQFRGRVQNILFFHKDTATVTVASDTIVVHLVVPYTHLRLSLYDTCRRLRALKCPDPIPDTDPSILGPNVCNAYRLARYRPPSTPALKEE